MKRLLIVSSARDWCAQENCFPVGLLIRNAFPTCVGVEVERELLPGVHERVPDLIILRLPGASVQSCLADIRARWHSVPVLALICGETEAAASVLRSSLDAPDDFVSCPFQDIDVLLRVHRLLETGHPAPSCEPLPQRFNRDALVGESERFLLAVAKIPAIAASDATVLITGETGTGKELFARAIHYNGARRRMPFIPLNCGAMPDALVENELFGHARGAYTDASSAQKGLLAEAEGGTLFLDEIDALSLSGQTKLLRLLQDHGYRPLGSTHALTANVRIVAATNANLRVRVAAKTFREDLYYRLNILPLPVPALRERLADIPMLAGYFLQRFGQKYGRDSMRISRPALRKMMAYSWPGNVRELETLVHRAVVLAQSTLLQPADVQLPDDIAEVAEAEPLRAAKTKANNSFERF